ncbi:MAG: cyclic nucleotide-binding domain-containing protein [Atopobiaceae bacterium]|nr:cyclic nucleotide-binding domain-containing protein [Atopobiaceae bacterium]
MRRQTFGHDDIIFREGEYAESMFEVESGSVGIYANYGSPDARLLATLGQNEYFGEMGLAECYPRSATAVALEDGTTLDEIGADEFSDFFVGRPDVVLTIMRSLSARLRETNARYLEARQTIHDAVEAERAGAKRSNALASKLTRLLRFGRATRESSFRRS